jgi:hypothetical protein
MQRFPFLFIWLFGFGGWRKVVGILVFLIVIGEIGKMFGLGQPDAKQSAQPQTALRFSQDLPPDAQKAIGAAFAGGAMPDTSLPLYTKRNTPFCLDRAAVVRIAVLGPRPNSGCSFVDADVSVTFIRADSDYPSVGEVELRHMDKTADLWTLLSMLHN